MVLLTEDAREFEIILFLHIQ